MGLGIKTGTDGSLRMNNRPMISFLVRKRPSVSWPGGLGSRSAKKSARKVK